MTRGARAVGLFGGSFDPPHDGHLQVASKTQKSLELDSVWWLITPQNPLKKHAPADRQARLQAVQKIAHHPKFRVFDALAELGEDACFAIDTLRHLQAKHSNTRFVWIMGADSFIELPRWKAWGNFVGEVAIAVYPRPKYTLQLAASAPATRFAAARLPSQSAGRLKLVSPPAWVLLDGAVSDLSSSNLRNPK